MRRSDASALAPGRWTGRGVIPLDPRHRPAPVAITMPGLARAAEAARRELRRHARTDRDRCCGFFPALFGRDGIVGDLPACAAFADQFPHIVLGAATYRFSFLRLSLVQQGKGPTYHLDTDAATALTGDVSTMHEYRVLRLLLNLSSYRDRTLHYLDVDPDSVGLEAEGGYVRVSGLQGLGRYRRAAVMPPRCGSTVHGQVFPSNRVLHSGRDDRDGHFVAAFGTEVRLEDA